ncbi:MAG: C_GCAxxG_C_C family protein [Bacteroidales bacterium]|nr:C_GCAxxG_C_C family protein [Bacteroidales bacterium]
MMEMDLEQEAMRRSDRARAYFREGYNCAQSVALAFSDVIGEDPERIAKALSGFGGGMARLREVCGCVSGMAYVAGYLSPAIHPNQMEERTANYALVQELAGAFKAEYGSIVCRELLQMRKNDKVESPAPSERTAAYYAVRPCERQIGKAAEILARKIQNL